MRALHGARAGFGSQIPPAGDVNGDGFDDFLVGTDDTDGYINGSGILGLYSGGSSLSSTPWWERYVFEPGDGLGLAEVTGADLNGDGLSDIIASAPGADGPTADNVGAIYVFYAR